MSIIDGPKKKVGRPSVDSEAVKVRIERTMLDALDEWIEQQDAPKPNRPEAIRRLIKLGLDFKN